ncbi:lysosomal protective protein-like [Latimeria chalumnae]|uniref:lysosomal protective protein-like n=1 Tax=Latimeria chalumnae TaxID=7897 RepID=UPI00313C2207
MWLSKCSLLLVLISIGCSSSQYAPDQITYLPGLSEMPSFKQWSGYLQAGPNKYFHYWFVESQNNPSTDPLVLWLNGGPGCSSMEGLLAENGPFHINNDGSLYLNQYSWNTVANMLYMESPAGVGYSYSTNGDYQTYDEQVATDNYLALQSFFSKFPNFVGNDFYIFAESCGGVYAPTLAYQIVTGSAQINFKGFGVGNGMSSYDLNDQSLVYFGYYHGLFGEDVWAELKQYCCSYGSCNFYKNTNSYCANLVSQVLYMIQDTGLNIYSLYSPCWGGVKYNQRYAADLSNLFRNYNFDVTVPKVSRYQPWYYNDQIAGYFQEYEKITFLTVKGSGHMVPQFRPGQAQKMFKSFISNTVY